MKKEDLQLIGAVTCLIACKVTWDIWARQHPIFLAIGWWEDTTHGWWLPLRLWRRLHVRLLRSPWFTSQLLRKPWWMFHLVFLGESGSWWLKGRFYLLLDLMSVSHSLTGKSLNNCLYFLIGSLKMFVVKHVFRHSDICGATAEFATSVCLSWPSPGWIKVIWPILTFTYCQVYSGA